VKSDKQLFKWQQKCLKRRLGSQNYPEINKVKADSVGEKNLMLSLQIKVIADILQMSNQKNKIVRSLSIFTF
jgi:hypothetical protein